MKQKHSEENFALLAGMHLDRGLERAELPAELGRRRGIEPHRDERIGDGAGRRCGALGRAAEPGRLAEQPVERCRGKGQPDHAADDRGEQD